MKRYAILFLLVGLPCFAAEPKKDPPPIILPSGPPTPPPNPAPVTKLAADQLFVARATVKATLIASPDGIVRVTTDTVPVRIRAKFVDGDGTYQTRNYDKPDVAVFSVEPIATGKVELIFIYGDQILRVSLDVTTGPAPPGPGPGPIDPLVQALADAAKADGATSGQVAQLAALYRQVVLQTIPNTSIKTVGDLFAKVKAAQDSLVPPDKIALLRKVIGKEFNAALGTSGTAPLDRTTAATVFTKLAQALEGVK